MAKVLLLIIDSNYIKCRTNAIKKLMEIFQQNNHELCPYICKINQTTDYALNSLSTIKYHDYNALIVISAHLNNSRKHFQNEPLEIIQNMEKQNKPILFIKADSNIEFASFGRRSLIASPSNFYDQVVKISRNVFASKEIEARSNSAKIINSNPNDCKFTRMPVFGISQDFYETKYPNKVAFCANYQLDPNQKIVIFLPGRLSKLSKINGTEFFRDLGNRVQLTFQQIETCRQQLALKGYQLVTKLHINDQIFPDQTLIHSLSEFKQIKDDDLIDALKYSSAAITIGSGIAYELFLFDLPTLELGSGCYCFRWSVNRHQKYLINHLFTKELNHGSNLIYGHHASLNEVKDLPKTLMTFLQQDYQITDFSYLKDHPLYGDTYYATTETFFQAIKDQLRI